MMFKNLKYMSTEELRARMVCDPTLVQKAIMGHINKCLILLAKKIIGSSFV